MTLNEGALCNTYVAQHSVAAPPPNEENGVQIDVPKEKHHGADLSERLGRDMIVLKAKLFTNVVAGGAENPSERCSGDIDPLIPHIDGA